jgi:eukaryotic-like serine/threonine-protein kinase
LVGIIALTGVIALAGWGYSKLASGRAITQTAQALAALPPTGTPAPPTSTPTLTETPTATATITMTPTPTLEIGSTQISPKDGMVQVYVPAGEFLMGSDTVKESQSYSEELPQHTVYLDAFWIDRTEITNAQYASCVAEGHCTLPGNTISSRHSSYYGDVQYADYPVVYVNWNQSQAYCAWAGRRLSSEAEWEKAARGTDGRLYPWGNAAPDQNRLNYNSNKGDTTAVGSYIFGASPYGALNMAGNVWEWVNDWYSSTYYQNSPARNPLGPDSGTDRGLRGGSWNNSDRYIRTAQRYSNIPAYWYYDVGFRCAASTTP